MQSADGGIELSRHTEVPFVFKGSAREYFGIWLANLLLSVITVGLYSPWAKVRTKRYIYRHTFLESHAFEYHATGWQIFKGRAVATAFVLGLFISVQFYPVAANILLGPILFFLAPWFITRIFRFRARVISFRNLRFNFTGTTFGAIVPFFILPVIAFGPLYLANVGQLMATTAMFGFSEQGSGFTAEQIAMAIQFGPLAIFMPMATWAANRFLLTNLWYGDTHFESHLHLPFYYGIYLMLFLVLLGTYYLREAYELPLTLSMQGDDVSTLVITAISAIVIIGGLIGLLHAFIVNHMISGLVLDDHHDFGSHLDPVTYAWITVTNIFAIILTLGLAYPWAVIRVWRYRCDNTDIITDSDFSNFEAGAGGSAGAAGEEFVEAFDLDIGFSGGRAR